MRSVKYVRRWLESERSVRSVKYVRRWLDSVRSVRRVRGEWSVRRVE